MKSKDYQKRAVAKQHRHEQKRKIERKLSRTMPRKLWAERKLKMRREVAEREQHQLISGKNYAKKIARAKAQGQATEQEKLKADN